MRINFTIILTCSLLLIGPSLMSGQVFSNFLPIPYTMQTENFVIDITAGSHNFDPNGFIDSVNLNVNIPTYCYNELNNSGMSYLGPTLIFEKGNRMYFDIANFLPDDKPTTVHWHGLNIPARSDGGPHQVIKNGFNWLPNFTIIDPVQTLWYHTHLMNFTTDQVIRGLAGMIIIEDDEDPLRTKLPRDYGVNDIPIIIQEKGFNIDRSANPPVATSLVAGEKPGNGVFTLVNGVVGSVKRVPPEIVRLRVLNGSPRKMFNIGLSTTLNNPTDFADMWLMATSGGYIDYPRNMKSSLMAIGDRREFLVDFSLYPDGDTVYMSNLAVPQDANYGKTPGAAIMAFVIDDSIFPNSGVFSIPSALINYELAPGPVFKERQKFLLGNAPGGGQGGVWTIDGTPMDLGVINDTVLVNTKEKWIITNTTTKAHPFHIHKVQFQVVEYVGKLDNSNVDSLYKHPNLPTELIGYKDVQLIREGATLEFEARFDSFPSPAEAQYGYMYHCHILTHEDTSMMHQFVVVDSTDFFVSVEEYDDIEPFDVFPNPASQTITLTGPYMQSGILRMLDIQGKVLKEESFSSTGNKTISLEGIPKGIVLIELIGDKRRFIKKVTVH